MAYYNKLRDKLRNETDLPEDLSWENMQSGIYDKMSQKKKKRRFFIWWLLPIFIVGGLGTFWYVGNDKKSILQLEKSNTTNSISPKNIIAKVSESSVDKSMEITDQKPVGIVTNDKNKVQNFTNLTDQKKLDNQSIKSTKNNDNPKTIITNNSQNNTEETLVKNDANPINITTALNDQSSENNTTNQGNSYVTNVPAPKPFFMIEPLILPINEEVNSLSNRSVTLADVTISLPTKKQKNKYLGAMDLMFGSGISFWNIGSPTLSPLDTKDHKALFSEKELPSFSFALRNDISINKHFFVSALLDYQQLYSVFTYNGTQTKTTLLDDVVVSITENLISGEQWIVRGSAKNEEKTNRKLQTRNEMSRSSLSLLPGLQHNVRNWAFKVNAGPTIGLFTRGTGKTLWNDEVVAYDGDLPQYNNSVKIGFTSSALVKYYVSQRWFLHSSILYQKYVTNHSADPTQIIKPSLWNISAGVGYSF